MYIRTPCVKIMTTSSAVAWWVSMKYEGNPKEVLRILMTPQVPCSVVECICFSVAACLVLGTYEHQV